MYPRMKQCFWFFLLMLLVYSVHGYSQSGWQWNNPLPQGNDLNEVSILNSSTIIAVGDYGTVIRSTDGGFTWVLAEVNTVRDLRDVDFIGSTGYVVGDSGVIVKTTNAGLQWINLYSGTKKELSGVSFSTSLIGTAVGKNGIVLRTTDGGNHWIEQPTFVTPNLNDVDFVNDSLGYITGDSSLFMKTTNGGATWLKSWIGNYGVQMINSKVIFLDSDTGWIVSTIGFVSMVLKSTNGGSGWYETVGSAGLYYFYDVQFNDAHHGIAIATNGDPRLYITSDGGASWNLRDIGISRFNPRAVALNQSGNAIIVGGDGRIFRSSNYGITWENASTYSRGVIRGISFPKNEIGIAIKDSMSIVRTTDDGSTWITTPIDFGQIQFDLPIMFGIHFYDTSYGAICTWNGGYLFTSNGGDSWIRRNGPNANKILLLDSVQVLAIGPGTVYRSTDEGNTWTAQQLALYSQMRGLHFYQSLIGYIVGDSGFVYRSIDKGVSWTRQNINVITPLKDVVVFDSLKALIVGNIGTILITTDAGVTWHSSQSGLQSDLQAVCFISRDRGWVVGSSGAILYTSNGGANWIKQHSGTRKDLLCIFFTSTTTGYIAGEGGTILKTTDGGVPVELSSLTASLVDENRVELHWTTANETNNYGFEIERRFITHDRQQNWERIGFVAGNGTTISSHNYSFTDLFDGQSVIRHLKSLQYRLKQIDYDGRHEYSSKVEVVLARTDKEAILFDSYPNPIASTSPTTISFWLNADSHARLEVFNVMGRKITMLYDGEAKSGLHEVRFTPAKGSSGMYFYHLEVNGKRYARKFIVH